MRRRKFITLFAGATALWPIAARAQQVMPVIGFLHSTSPVPNERFVAGFRKGLSEGGFVEGQNVAIEYRWAEGRYDRLPWLAADLVRRKVAVIATAGGVPPPLAAKVATSTIPIIFVIGSDPVEFGLVESLNRPGGNATGVSLLSYLLDAKRLELMRELVSGTSVVAMLVNPTSQQAVAQVKEAEANARAVRQELVVLMASTETELSAAFETLVAQKAKSVLVSSDPFFLGRREQIVALAQQHAVPAAYQWREFVDAGGLFSYGTSITDAYRHAGLYTARILKGERPVDLPVQQSVKVELVINLKTAKSLGLEVPTSILLRADEVIE